MRLGRRLKRGLKRATRMRGLKRFAKGGARLAKKGIKFVGRALATAALAPLLPFKKGMKKILSKKGVSTRKMSFPDIVKAFYNKVVIKSKNFDGKNYVEIADHIDLDRDHFVGEAAMVVTAIIAYFQSAKEAKAKGEPQSSDDALAAEEAEEVQEELEAEAQSEMSDVGTEMLPDEDADEMTPEDNFGGKRRKKFSGSERKKRKKINWRKTLKDTQRIAGDVGEVAKAGADIYDVVSGKRKKKKGKKLRRVRRSKKSGAFGLPKNAMLIGIAVIAFILIIKNN